MAALLAQGFEETGNGGDAVHVAGHRLDDDAGDLVAHLVEQVFHLLGIVVFQGQGVLGQAGGNAGRTRHAEGQGAGAGLDQQRIAVTVIATLELDDLVAAGMAAREADRRHRCLGAGVGHANLIHGGKDVADAFRHLDFGFGRCTEAQTLGGRLLYGLDDLGIGVAADHRPPGTDIIDIGLAVDIVEKSALGAFDERGRAAHAIEGTHRRVDAAGNDASSALHQLFGKAHLRSSSGSV